MGARLHLPVCVHLQDISAGEQVVRVPLRLAITDVLEAEQKQQLAGEVSQIILCIPCGRQMLTALHWQTESV